MHAGGAAREDGWRTYHATVPPERSAADFTVRIVPAHPAANIPLEAPHIRWNR
jgi:starch phosphorylase